MKFMTVLIIIFSFACGSLLAFADTATVTNNVSVSANTGGSVGSNVNNGKASVEIDVDQSVNGEAQAPVHVVTSSDAQSVSVSVQSNVISQGSTTVATSVVKVDQEQKIEGIVSSPSTSTRHKFQAPVLNIFSPTGTVSTSVRTSSASGAPVVPQSSFFARFHSWLGGAFHWVFRF